MILATMLLVLCANPASDQDDATPIILDFTASWCGPCQQMVPAVAQLKKSGYPVKAVDYDTSPLVKRYKVTAVPTFVVIDSDGKELDRTSGYQPAANIAAMYNDATARLEDTGAIERRKPSVKTAAESREPASESAELPKPWETVVRIRIDNHLSRSLEFGSGTIIRSTADETIILTCAHIFKVGSGQQYQPQRFPLKITVELSDGQLKARSPKDANGGFRAGVHMVEEHRGEAVDYDFGHDVGLIRIRPGKILPSTPVVPSDWQPRTGLVMTTVGCSRGKDATAWTTEITKPLVRGLDGHPSYEAVECLYAPIEGRSGGGLYTRDGKLAGVCDFAEPRGGHGLYATPRAIHKFLDRNDLALCYAPDAGRSKAKSGTMLAKGQPSDRARRSQVADTLRTQSPDEPRQKRLTIPTPDDLKVPRIVETEDEEELTGDSSIDRRRKPTWSSNQANVKSAKLLGADLERPEAMDSESTQLKHDLSDIRDQSTREKEKTLPAGPATKPRSAAAWKAAK